jgi:hypothetical protein
MPPISFGRRAQPMPDKGKSKSGGSKKKGGKKK